MTTIVLSLLRYSFLKSRVIPDDEAAEFVYKELSERRLLFSS